MDPTLRYIDRRLKFEHREGEIDNLCVTYEQFGYNTNELIATQSINLSDSICDQISRHTSSIRELNPTELADLGWVLSTVAFADSVRHAFLRDYDEARSTDRRVRVHIDDHGSGVSGWPWEFLWLDHVGFLAIQPSSSIVRACRSVVNGTLPIQALLAEKFHILIVWADPGGPYEQLDAESQISSIVRILKKVPSPAFDIRMLVPKRNKAKSSRIATLSNIQASLHETEPHVLCFFTHGEFDEEENQGVLVLESEGPGRECKRVGALELQETLAPYTNVSVVLFDGCKSASRGPHGNGLSLAEAIASQGRSVIGMQYVWPAAACHPFWREFFATISVPQPIDNCVFAARDYLYRLSNFLPDVSRDDQETFIGSRQSGHSSVGDWGYPVLYRPALLRKAKTAKNGPLSGATLGERVRHFADRIGMLALEKLLKINVQLLEALLAVVDDKTPPDLSRLILSSRDNDFLRVLLAGENHDIQESVIETSPVWFTHLLTSPEEINWICKDVRGPYQIRIWTLDHDTLLTREVAEPRLILSQHESQSIPENTPVRWEVKLPKESRFDLSFDLSLVRGIFTVFPPGRASVISLHLSRLHEHLWGLEREFSIAECCLKNGLYHRLNTRLRTLQNTIGSSVERFALQRLLASIYNTMHDRLSEHLLADPEGVWAAELANRYVDASYEALIQG